MKTLAAGLSFIDLQFQQTPRVIATGVLHGPGGVALVDPGPTSALGTLTDALSHAGLSFRDVSWLLLTHIHLDHAGASGTLVRQHRHLRVYVHDLGAPHLADPSKLLASATRLYGDDMERLWGEVAPVPSDAIVTLAGGERINAGGRALDVAYTPGHASHHVSYFCADSGVAFVGDTAGIRLAPDEYVLPPTPPPDIDLELWGQSLKRIDAWRPDTLFLTHFGPAAPTGPHLTEFKDRLENASRLVLASLAREGTDEDRAAWFADELGREMRRRLGDAGAQTYETAGRLDLSWRGLARYWRKRDRAA
jgi:glyoxylase-like metal-dependent hydrolase (beta-lactamase superfamily II)